MAENVRVRVEPDLVEYMKAQAERVLGKPAMQVTGADLTTITNRLLYEHKLAQSMAKTVPFVKLFNWLTSWVPSALGGSKVMPLEQAAGTQALEASEPPDSFDFDADLGDLYEQEAA